MVFKSEAESFDYLIAMDKSNYNNMIEELENEPSNLFLMRDFDEEDKGADVPDPYYGSNDGFEDGEIGNIIAVGLPDWEYWGGDSQHHSDSGRTIEEKAIALFWVLDGVGQSFDANDVDCCVTVH